MLICTLEAVTFYIIFQSIFLFYGYCCTELEQKRLALISKPLQEQLLTVELCEENRSIIVRNIVKKLYSHEALDMYFSSPAVSGGEAVEAINMMGSDTALITFKDPQGWIVVYIVKSCKHCQMKVDSSLGVREFAKTPPPHPTQLCPFRGLVQTICGNHNVIVTLSFNLPPSPQRHNDAKVSTDSLDKPP